MNRRKFLRSTAASGVAAGLALSAARRPYALLPCEEACTVPEVLAAQSQVAPVRAGPAAELQAMLLDLGEGRLRSMDEAGVDLQILSLGSPGVQNLDGPTAVSLSRIVNDRLAAAVAAHPSRFAALATFAAQNPIAAAKELERAARSLKMRGALINSHTNGEYLDDRKFWPIFETLEALDMPLYIHPRDASPGLSATRVPGFNIGWGFALEAGTHAVRLIASGVFDRFPKLTIVLGHMGEGIPFLLERIDNRYAFETSLAVPPVKLERKPSDYFRSNFFVTTSGMNWAAPLAATIATIGIDRVLFAIDYPFETNRRGVAAFDAIRLSDEDKRKICETNVRRVFRVGR